MSGANQYTPGKTGTAAHGLGSAPKHGQGFLNRVPNRKRGLTVNMKLNRTFGSMSFKRKAIVVLLILVLPLLIFIGSFAAYTIQRQNDQLLLSSKIGPVLANNFPPQLLKNLFSVSEAPALIIKVQYLALMRQPVQQSCCEDSVAKKLRPAIKAFI